MGSARITPTAHYTARIWQRNGLSHPAFATCQGRLYDGAMELFNRANRIAGHRTIETMLLARHRAIDAVLRAAIEAGEVGQVVEIAAGLSPRGFRFASRYPELVYVESDLPAMVAHKRRVLDRAGLRGARHHVVELDALARDGRGSLRGVAGALLAGDRGTAVITEGLLTYLPGDAVRALWTGIAHTLGSLAGGVYLADLHVSREISSARATASFRSMLRAFTRGDVYTHFAAPDEAIAALRAAGFARATARDPSELGVRDGADPAKPPIVRVIEARC